MKYFVRCGDSEFVVDLRGSRATVESSAGAVDVELTGLAGDSVLTRLADAAATPADAGAAGPDPNPRPRPPLEVSAWGTPAPLDSLLRILVRGQPIEVVVETQRDRLMRRVSPNTSGAASVDVRAPMSGAIVRVLVKVGEPVAKGEAILTLEAMKMENEICAEISGVLESIHVEEGAVVDTGSPLARIVAEVASDSTD